MVICCDEQCSLLSVSAACLELHPPSPASHRGHTSIPGLPSDMLSTFLEGPEAGCIPDDFPEGGLGVLCPSPSTSSMVGMVSEQHRADKQRGRGNYIPDSTAKISKGIHPEHGISLNQASASFDNICTFSKVFKSENLCTSSCSVSPREFWS